MTELELEEYEALKNKIVLDDDDCLTKAEWERLFELGLKDGK